MGLGFAGSYSDLRIWAGWCLICAVMALISMFLKKKEKKIDKKGSINEDAYMEKK